MVNPVQVVTPLRRTRHRFDVATRGAPSMVGVLIVVAVVLHGVNGSHSLSAWWLGNVTMALSLGSVGAILVRRVPRNPIGWLFVVAAGAQALLGTAREWAVFVVVRHHRLPGATLAGWLGTWPLVVSLATFPIILLLFPDGDLPSRRWRPVMVALVVSLTLVLVRLVSLPGVFDEDLPGRTNPLGIDWAPLDVVGVVGLIGLPLGLVLAVVSLVVRLRRGGPEVRQQLRWIVVAGTILAVEILVEMLVVGGDAQIFTVLGPLAMTLFVASIGVAVLRYRLWDLDLVIRWTLVYAILTVLVAAAYLGVVAASYRMSGDHAHLGWSVLAAGVTVAVFAVARDHVQRWVERMVYGDRRDPYRALASLGERLDQPASTEGILDEVADSVARSLRLDYVALATPGRRLLASAGTARSTTLEVPLLFRGRAVGTLIAAPRAGARIGSIERAVLGDLARPVAAVVQAVSAGEEAQRSRQALVTAREAERRRVRRDLHDGLGPALAAVRMKLDSATVLLDQDPVAAKTVLLGLTDDISCTIDDIRRLVYDLQPPVLAEIGLLPALRQQARSFTGPRADGGRLEVEVLGPEALEGLSAAVEVAAYRIVGEGLANVARHARADRCQVTVRLNGGLEVCIDDDGVGLSGQEVPGVGTASMVERAMELGGSCRIGRSPRGGTRIHAHLPVAAEAASDGRDGDHG